MSDAEPTPESMSRAELERTVSDLREQTDRLDERIGELDRKTTLVIGSLQSVLSAVDGGGSDTDDPLVEMRDRAADFGTEVESLRAAVTSHGETLATMGDVGDATTSKDEKIGAVVSFAEQTCDPGQDKVLVSAKEIRGKTGVSRRYAYDLIDDIGGLDENGNGGDFGDGRFPWAAVRTETSVPTANGHERKPKALKIDFGRVHTDEGSVNKFTTRSGGEGTR